MVSLGYDRRRHQWLLTKIPLEEVGPQYELELARWEGEGGR